MRFSVRNRLIVAEVVAAQIASGYNSVAFAAQWLNSMRAPAPKRQHSSRLVSGYCGLAPL